MKKVITLIICLIFIVISTYSFANINQSDFKVIFSGTPDVSDNNKVKASITDNYNAIINVSGLTMKENEEKATFIVQNTSKELFANLDVEITNSNKEYFSIESKIEDDFLVNGEATKVVVIVKLLKEPIIESENTLIGVKLKSTPKQPGESSNLKEEEKETEDKKNIITTIIDYYEKDITPKTGNFKII